MTSPLFRGLGGRKLKKKLRTHGYMKGVTFGEGEVKRNEKKTKFKSQLVYHVMSVKINTNFEICPSSLVHFLVHLHSNVVSSLIYESKRPAISK